VCTVVAALAPLIGAASAGADTVTLRTIVFGNPGWVPITGDWNGDGRTEIGAYDPSTGTFYEADATGHTIATIRFGNPDWTPITGDWNGDGATQIGAYDPSTETFYEATPTGTQAAASAMYGDPGDVPITGDWTGTGPTQIGVYRPSLERFYWGNDVALLFGNPGDDPVTGDWDGQGPSEVGVFRPSNATWYLADPSGSVTQSSVAFGDTSDEPITGDWDGRGRTELGVYDPSTATFVLRLDTPTPAVAPPTAPVPGAPVIDPVQRSPVTTTLPAPRRGPRPRVRVRIAERWTWDHAHTRLRAFRVVGRPRRHARLTVACRGRGCPFLRETIHLPAHGGAVAHLAGARFHAGDRITITISAPHRVAERGTIRIRDGRVPLVASR
jgi:hypothetical protein